jgi:hypothetical protein
LNNRWRKLLETDIVTGRLKEKSDYIARVEESGAKDKIIQDVFPKGWSILECVLSIFQVV